MVILKNILYRLPGWVYRHSRLNRLELNLLPLAQRQQISAAWKDLCRVQPPVCESLQDWCAAHPEVQHTLLSPGVNIERHLPNTIEPTILAAFTSRTKTQIRPRFLYTLHDVTLVGANGLIILPDGQYAAEAIYGLSHLKVDPVYSSPVHPRREDKKGEYFTLLGEFSNTANYFHWIHDGLLRLHGLDSEFIAQARIIVPPYLKSYQRETLQLLGIRKEQLVTFPAGAVWKIETLHFASLPASGADLLEAEVWLRDKLLAAANVTERVGDRRLYLSRRFDLHGRIVNEEQVVECLSNYGFEVVYPAKLTVQEQIKLFAQAEIIVSGSNSGLMNMLFAPSGTKVLEILELTRAERLAYVHWSITEVLGFELWYIVGDTRTNMQNPQRPDLYVPSDKLIACLDKMQIEPRQSA